MIIAALNRQDAEHYADIAGLARHFPGLERAIPVVWQHVTNTDDVGCGDCEPLLTAADETASA